jgi:hypothetical protein
MPGTRTLINSIKSRLDGLDRAVRAAQACADRSVLPATGPASLIPAHLHTVQAQAAALNADLCLLIATARALETPVPEQGAA